MDSGAGGLAKLIIDGLAVHPFGACRPNPCDWGTIEGKAFAARVDSSWITSLTVEKATTFSEMTLTLMLEADGRLRVDDFTHFTDESHRADYHTLNYFKRESTEQPAAAPAAKTAPVSPAIRKAAVGTSLAMWNADMLIPPAAYAVEGAPFEALIEETRTPLGSETTRRFVRVLRDSAGRQRYEDLVNADCKACKAVVARARVFDVVGQRSIHIDPVTRIAVSCPAPSTSQPVRVLASTPEAQKSSNSGRLGRLLRKDESKGEAGEPQVAGLQVTLTSATHEASSGHTVDAQTAQAVNELWTSPLYRMPVKRVIEDPGYGHIDIEIVHFKPGEPDAALFQTPVGYVVRTEADDACGRTRTSAGTRE